MSKHQVNINDLLSSDFKPEKYANTLIKETTTSQDATVDLSPALTRLKYDIEEIETRMEDACRDNSGSLTDVTVLVSKLDGEVKTLQPAMENLVGTYSKLQRDFLEPYQKAASIENAAQKLSYTASLTRGLTWYLQLALQARDTEFKREDIVSTGRAGKAMLRTANAIKGAETLVERIPDLRKINAVANFQKELPDIRSSLIESATRLLKDFDGYGTAQVKLAARAIVIVGGDLPDVVKTHVKTLIGSTVLQLTRNSSSTDDYKRTFSNAVQRNSVVDVLVSAENEALTPETPSSNKFWDSVAQQLDQKLKTLSVANPTAFTNMIARKDTILNCTQAVANVHKVFEKYLNK